MNNLFLNLTQHKLLPSQLEKIKEMNAHLISFREIFDSEFVDRLTNSPDNFSDLHKLSKDLLDELLVWRQSLIENGRIENDEKIYIHFPIGSSAFQFVFGRYLGTLPYYYYNCFTLLISHSERISYEIEQKDGTIKKESKFIFSHFIEV